MGDEDDFEAKEQMFISSLTDAYRVDVDYFQHVLDVLGSYKGDCPQTLHSMGITLFQQNPALLEKFFIVFPWARHPEDLRGKESPGVDRNKSLNMADVLLCSSSNEVFSEMSASKKSVDEEINEYLKKEIDDTTLAEDITVKNEIEENKISEVQRNNTNDKVIENESISCPECKTRFKTKRYLRNHIRLKKCKGRSVIECPECKMQFKAKEYLRDHVKLETCKEKIESISCPECEAPFTSKRCLRVHIKLQRCKNKTEAKGITCAECKMRFKAEKYLREHIRLKRCKIRTVTEIISCPECNVQFKAKENLRKHIRLQRCKINAESGFISCPKCKMQFKAKEYLRNHIRLQRCKEKMETKSNSCTKCKTQFKAEKHLRQHIKLKICQKKTEFDVISCPTCEKQFKAKKYFREHIRLQRCCQENETYECSKCKSSFEKLGHLLQHNKKNFNCQEKIVKTENVSICSNCNKEFESKKNLMRHEVKGKCKAASEVLLKFNDFKDKESTLNENELELKKCTEFQCKQCDKVFDTIRKLRWHKEKEHSTQSFTCTQCIKEFATKETLTKHLKNCHKDPHGYKCNICDSCSFENALELSVHLGTVHNRVCCDYCQKNFSNADSLKCHYEAVHMKSRPYSCDQCDSTFASKGVLNDHIYQAHLQLWRFPCLECKKKGKSKGFKRKVHWKNHMKKDHSEVDFEACYDADFKEDFLFKMSKEVGVFVGTYSRDSLAGRMRELWRDGV